MTPMRNARRRFALSAGFTALSLLAACAVGPDFETPAPPGATRYTPDALPDHTAGTGGHAGAPQHFAAGEDIAAQWWTLFHSAPLDALVARALRNNPDIESAQAALDMAREMSRAQSGFYYPTLAAGLSASRQRSSAAIAPVPSSNALNFSLYTPQLSVSYTPDVFGLNRRSVEALDAQSAAARFALLATQITLASNVVAAAIQEAALRGQIAATRDLVAANSAMLKTLRAQWAKGYASRLDVAAQESALAQTEATLPPLEKQLAQQRDLLAALAGETPDRELSEQFTLEGLQLPQDVPVSLPSRLVAQRPDVRQAEENLHAASAQIGIAIANRLPAITLTADAGTMALGPGAAFDSTNGFWNFAGGLTQPVFDGGTLKHRERAARAAYRQAAAQYRATVLAAFQNVADTLHALESDADALKADAAAASAAKVTRDLTRRQAEAGELNTLALFTAESAYQQAVIARLQAQANRYADTAALFQALGGGWWNDPANAKAANGG